MGALEDRFSRIISPFLIKGLSQGSWETPLKDQGVDSMQLVALVAALEEGLSLRFEDEEITRENFGTPRSLLRLVSKKIPT